jgi:hypothetical protein
VSRKGKYCFDHSYTQVDLILMYYDYTHVVLDFKKYFCRNFYSIWNLLFIFHFTTLKCFSLLNSRKLLWLRTLKRNSIIFLGFTVQEEKCIFFLRRSICKFLTALWIIFIVEYISHFLRVVSATGTFQLSIFFRRVTGGNFALYPVGLWTLMHLISETNKIDKFL